MKVPFLSRKSKSTDFYNPDETIAERHLKVTDYLGDGVFLRECGGLGCVYELSNGFYDEPMTEEELSIEFQKLNRLMSTPICGFPYGSGNTVVQFICSQREITVDNGFKANSPSGEIIDRENEFVNNQGLIRRRYLLTILWRPTENFSEKIQGAVSLGFASSPDAYLKRILEKKISLLNHLRRLEANSEISIDRWGDEEFLSYVNSVFNRGKELPYNLKSEEFHGITRNIINEKASGNPEGFGFDDGGNISSFYLPNLPPVFALGRLKTFMTRIPSRSFEFVWTFSDGSIEISSEHFLKMLWFSQGPSFEAQRDDFTALKAKVGPRNPYGKVSISITTYDVDEDIEVKMGQAAIIYLGCPIVMEKQLGYQLVTRALPLNSAREENGIMGRYTTKTLDEAIGFVPIYDGPSLDGIRLWQSNRGFPTGYNIFEGEGNRTAVVLGRMGAGKSVKNGSLILEFMTRFPNGIVRIVDRKSSYSKLADLLGGKMVKFTKESFKKSPFSPFAIKKWTEEDVKLVVSFIVSSIIQVNKDPDVQSVHTEIISEALKRSAVRQMDDEKYHEETGKPIDPHFTWEEVKTNLEPAAEAKKIRSREVVEEIRRWTLPFEQGGQFDFIFCCREKEGSMSGEHLPFLGYDLEGIEDLSLKNMVSRLVAMKISRDCEKYPRSTPKLIVFEELGVYLEGETPEAEKIANQFVMNITKTIRKENGIPFGITNAVEDFFMKKGGVSFWKQSMTKIFLPFTSDMVATLEGLVKEGKIKGLTRADLDIIESLVMIDGLYAQAYVVCDVTGFRGVVNMYLSPSMYALLNNTPSDRQRYEDLIEQGKSTIEALDITAREFEERKKSRDK